jgi:hypothetical protein
VLLCVVFVNQSIYVILCNSNGDGMVVGNGTVLGWIRLDDDGRTISDRCNESIAPVMDEQTCEIERRAKRISFSTVDPKKPQVDLYQFLHYYDCVDFYV